MKLLFSPGAISVLVLRNFLAVSELSSLAKLEAFTLESISYTKRKPGTRRFRHDRNIPVFESRIFESSRIHRRRCSALVTGTRQTTTTSLKMVENTNDPDVLLKMVEDLAMQEITPEILAKMEMVEVALANFMEEKSGALLDQQMNFQNGLGEDEPLMKPLPPSIPPPGALLGGEDFRWRGQFENDLAKAGFALEKLRQRMREEDVLLEAEHAWQLSVEEEEILLQAEEALRKSREAAKKRKAEAERRSFTAAKLSGGFQQRFKNIKHRNEQDQPEDLTMKSLETNEEYTASDHDRFREGFESQGQKGKRRTIELGTLFGKWTGGKISTKIDSDDDWLNEELMQELDNGAPEVIPVLYDWVQDDDGCITGKIRRSINYSDGATISTSPVIRGAREGTVVLTESGSRYFLDNRSTTEGAEGEGFLDAISGPMPIAAKDNNIRTAPDGVPTVKCWEFRKGSGIVGLIYGSPDADDGDYIETSPIVDGEIDNYSVVYTQSGSCYFLSGDPPENALDTLLTFRQGGSNGRGRDGGTITLTKRGRRTEDQVEASPRSRSTFSLFNLFDGKKNTKSSAPQPLAPPSPDKEPPTGTPTLTGYVFNDDGTITGYIFGSPKISDGYLITTSRIREGNRRQFETVTTETGSMYFLG